MILRRRMRSPAGELQSLFAEHGELTEAMFERPMSWRERLWLASIRRRIDATHYAPLRALIGPHPIQSTRLRRRALMRLAAACVTVAASMPSGDCATLSAVARWAIRKLEGRP